MSPAAFEICCADLLDLSLADLRDLSPFDVAGLLGWRRGKRLAEVLSSRLAGGRNG